MKEEKKTTNQGVDKRPSYKDSLNLLKTDFGMRANSSIREPQIQSFWKEKGIDFELGLANQGPTFTLHDGPPYANGTLHMGHALNKVLKDIINKFHILNGRKVRFIPGWDCHGLPIELKVLQKLGQKERKALTPLELRKKAASFALEQVDSQMKGFKRWGVWADWSNPYLTLQKEYESSQIELFGQMALKGYIYRGLKPVHWSPSSRTALAEAELEYPEGHTSPSIYVGYPVNTISNDLRKDLLRQGLQLPLEEEGLSKNLRLAIWTTTPWTLPANVAVSVNKNLSYVFAKDEEGKITIIASDLLNEFSEIVGITFKNSAFVKGSQLEGLLYRNPLFDRISPVVLGGEYITTQSGTGLVHTAPGHGIDDFKTGTKYSLPILCPVDEGGNLTSEAGKFVGLNVLKDANKSIISALDELGYLIKERPYIHKYPYDWRTKKPTIFRATEQWFASVEGFRKDALNAIQNVEWLPETGLKRIKSMVEERGDWCISRQRTWGVPIPVFYEKETNEVLLNAETIDHIKKLISQHGADIWWELDESQLLPPAYAPESHKWKKGMDTMDVWFDSGSSWSAVTLDRESINYPADLYLEGSDQHRGWFQSSLLTSVAAKNKAPYLRVLTHGFALDENGRKMSKSLGNIVDPLVIINGGSNMKKDPAFGADVLRLWVSSVDYSSDVPIGSTILKQLSDVYRKVRNTARYLLGNLHDFDPSKNSIQIEELPILDKWMLNKTAEVIDEISAAFQNYEFAKFFQLLQSYCVVDLSNFYLDIAKDRLYISSANDFRRRSCQTTISLIVEALAGLISPVLCHMAEDIWQNLPYEVVDESVFQRGWPTSKDSWRHPDLSRHVLLIKDVRTSINKALEGCRTSQKLGSSLEAFVRIEPRDNDVKNAINYLQEHGIPEIDNLKDWFIVSRLQLGGEPWADVLHASDSEWGTIEISLASGRKCERCWHYENDVGCSQEHPTICSRCVNILSRK